MISTACDAIALDTITANDCDADEFKAIVNAHTKRNQYITAARNYGVASYNIPADLHTWLCETVTRKEVRNNEAALAFIGSVIVESHEHAASMKVKPLAPKRNNLKARKTVKAFVPFVSYTDAMHLDAYDRAPTDHAPVNVELTNDNGEVFTKLVSQSYHGAGAHENTTSVNNRKRAAFTPEHIGSEHRVSITYVEGVAVVR